MSKGSWVRPHNHEQFSENYEKIFRQPIQVEGVEETQGDTVKQEPDVSVSQLQRAEARG